MCITSLYMIYLILRKINHNVYKRTPFVCFSLSLSLSPSIVDKVSKVFEIITFHYFLLYNL